MKQPVYASVTDVEEYLRDTEYDEAGVQELLFYASRLVEDYVLIAYTYDEEGLPIAQELLEAMRDATVAQVAYWVAFGINPGRGGSGVISAATQHYGEDNIKSFSFEGVSIVSNDTNGQEKNVWLQEASMSLIEPIQKARWILEPYHHRRFYVAGW